MAKLSLNEMQHKHSLCVNRGIHLGTTVTVALFVFASISALVLVGQKFEGVLTGVIIVAVCIVFPTLRLLEKWQNIHLDAMWWCGSQETKDDPGVKMTVGANAVLTFLVCLMVAALFNLMDVNF